MKICRFQHTGNVGYGLIEEVAGTSTITRSINRFPAGLNDFNAAAATSVALAEARLLAPTQPSKIVCVGRNYREHAKELNHEIPTSPLIFLKPPSSVIAPGEEIRRPHALSQRVDHEGELGVVIGRRCFGIREDEDVRPYILGYTCVNDVTARDLQNIDGQWTRAKGFDTFGPIGAEQAYIGDWGALSVVTRVNGVERQRARADTMVFAVPRLIAFISSVMTLEPGDVVATGTPSGTAALAAGDVVEVTIECSDGRVLSRVGNPVAAGE
jgi:2-keto-4-pentenoate hydratase/2-oxohepta-3-ene-1,7-dioic acid hydratase in catechol pathway